MIALLTLTAFFALGLASAGHESECIYQRLADPLLAFGPDRAVCLASQTGSPANSSQTTSQESSEPVFPPESWQQGGRCHKWHSGIEFCAFANPSFNGGLGVSMVTTPERLSDAAQRIAPRGNAQTTSYRRAYDPPYKEVDMPGKGKGLVTTRPIRVGTQVMARTPAIMLDGAALHGLNLGQLKDLLVDAVDMLPAHHREELLSLSTHDGASNHRQRLYKILATNAFQTGLDDGKTPFHATFTEISRMNHDCRPNCGYYFDAATLSHKVYATRDIMPGEELTVGYTDPIQLREERQAALHKHWGFNCTCPTCSAEPHLVAESDARIQQMRGLMQVLDDYTVREPRVDQAELLALLYDLEDVHGRIHEAYYRVAIEWNGIGEPGQAMKWARKCLHLGLIYRGPDKPFQDSMRLLLKQPENHWSWRFRIKKDDTEKEKGAGE